MWALCLRCETAKAPSFPRCVSDVAWASSHLSGGPSGLVQSIPRMYVCLNYITKRASIDTRCVFPRGDIKRAILVVESIPAQLWVAECCCRALVSDSPIPRNGLSLLCGMISDVVARVVICALRSAQLRKDPLVLGYGYS